MISTQFQCHTTSNSGHTAVDSNMLLFEYKINSNYNLFAGTLKSILMHYNRKREMFSVMFSDVTSFQT